MDKPPLLVYGSDNGYCELWDITREQFEDYRERIDGLLYGDKPDDDAAEKLEKEWRSHQIIVDTGEDGYVPDYVVKLAEIYGFEVDST